MVKHSFLWLFILFFNFFSVFAIDTLQWDVQHPISKKWINLGEKGSVQEAFWKAGVLPDPFYGENEKEYAWMENHHWNFKSEFILSEKELQNEFIDLELPSVDVYAKIFVNGKQVLQTSNVFHPYRVEVKELLHVGKNKITAIFTPPILYHGERYANEDFHYPAPNDVHDTAVAPYTRKPQFQFGWDWALRMNTIGFNEAVQVIPYSTNRILNTQVKMLEVSEHEATVQFILQCRNSNLKNFQWESKNFNFTSTQAIGNQLKATFYIKSPVLWWPRGQGEQPLYEDVWQLKIGETVQEIKKKFGVRKSKLLQSKDEWGTAYTIQVNGRKIFCKGANYIPQDVFLTRISDKEIERAVEQMAAANFNMIRIWGGGYYPPEIFYKKCDELGIMVWQDFMFACAMYPGDSTFLENVGKELDYQIPRIASHPSVVLFNGNNEVDVAWKNWGFKLQYFLNKKASTTIESAYADLFRDVGPKKVKELSNVPYIHTSPLSNWGKKEDFRHGSQHYWGVWHGKDELEEFSNKSGRFNAEYGFQSFPEYQTLLQFSTKEEWKLDSKVMRHHQKSYVGNGMIQKHANRLYGKAKGFEEFVYHSQLTQARAMELAISAHRIEKQRCSGTLYWQFNDCWPAPTWSSVDVNGNWKALHYKVKKLYEDVTVLAKEKQLNERNYFFVSDLAHHFSTTLKIEVFGLQGNLLATQNRELNVLENEVKYLSLKSFLDNIQEDYLLRFTWENINDKKRTRQFLHRENRTRKNEPRIEKKLQEVYGNYYLMLKTDQFLEEAWIYSEYKKMHVENNFRNLLPGEHSFFIQTKESLNEEDLQLKFK